MADPKSGWTGCERPRNGGICGRPGVGPSPYPEDHVRWVRICRPCLDEYDADVDAERAILAAAEQMAAWRAQAEVLADG